MRLIFFPKLPSSPEAAIDTPSLGENGFICVIYHLYTFSFPAGVGSFLTADGCIEMDAVIQDGRTMNTGGVMSIQNVRHPVAVARDVMDKVLGEILGVDKNPSPPFPMQTDMIHRTQLDSCSDRVHVIYLGQC